MSKPLRDQVNRMLDDGLPYRQISRQLRQHAVEVTENSISTWKNGGYLDYLREQRLRDESRLRYELTLNLARDEQGIDVFQSAHKVAAALICEAVAEFGAATLRQALKTNPLNLLRMLNSLSRLTAGGLKCERHASDQAQRDVERLHLEQQQQQQQTTPKKGLSPGSVQEMEHALHLM